MWSKTWPTLTVLAAALLSGVGLLGVNYLADDWVIVSHVARFGNDAAWTGSWLDLRDPSFHRPVFTALYDLEYRWFGADPVAAHAHGLLWHVLTSWLVLVFLRQLRVGREGALAGALLFALHPFHPATVGWLAGRSGSVAAAFTLMASVCYLRYRLRARRWWLIPFLLAATASALTKESGYLAFLTPFAIDLTVARPRPRLRAFVTTQCVAAAAVGLLLWLRHASLGTLVGGYGVRQGVLSGGAAGWLSLQLFGQKCLDTFLGIPQRFLGGESVLPSVVGSVTAAMILVGASSLVRSSRRDRRRPNFHRSAALLSSTLLLFQLGLIALVAGPGVFIVDAMRWYGAVIFHCAFLGVMCQPSMRHPVWRILPASLLLLFAYGNWKGQEFVARRAGFTDRVVEALTEEVGRLPDDVDSVFVTNTPVADDGVLLFLLGLHEALRPPFCAAELPPVYPVHEYMRLAGWERPREHPPLEALLYLQGKHPATISILHRYGPDGLEFNGFRTTDWARVTTRSEVSKLLGRLFPGERLQVDCRDLRFRIPSVGLAAVEFFCFLPAMDIRLRYAVNGPYLKQDLAPALRDLSSLSDHPTGYVIPVGYPSAPGAAPRLGPALEIRRAQ